MRHRLLTLLKPKASSGGGSFIPTQLANLAAWYDTTDAASITQTSNRVSQLNDKSGNANNLFQGTAINQPLLVGSGINGKPSIQFNDSGTATGLSCAHSTSLNHSAFTCFVVANHISSTGATEFLAGQWGIISVKESLLSLSAASAALVLASTDGNTGVTATGSTVSNNAPFLLRGSYADTDHVISNSLNNGVPATATLGGNINESTPLFMAGYFDQSGGVFSNPFNGYISEILFYTRRLSAPEIAQVNAYLAAKYALTLS